jgi:hypothetical protein
MMWLVALRTRGSGFGGIWGLETSILRLVLFAGVGLSVGCRRSGGIVVVVGGVGVGGRGVVLVLKVLVAEFVLV